MRNPHDYYVCRRVTRAMAMSQQTVCQRCAARLGLFMPLKATVLEASINNTHLECIRAAAAEANAVDELFRDHVFYDAGLDIGQETALLYYLRSFGCFDREIVRVLLDAGANPHVRGRDGRTPLMWAISCPRSNPAVVLDLISAGADINATSHLGWTCLHSAAGAGNVEFMHMAIEAGVSVEQTNDLGVAPLNVAVSHGHECCRPAVQVLVCAGANLHARDRNDRSALTFARLPRQPDRTIHKFLLHAHHAHTAYAYARVLVTGARRAGTQQSASTRVLSDYRLVAQVTARMASSTLSSLAFESLARLAITGQVDGDDSDDANALTPWPTRRRRTVMRVAGISSFPS